VFLVRPNSINLTHKGKAKVSVSVRCLVLVKMYGNTPKKLFIRIIKNRDVRINEFPLFSFPFLKIVFISWCNLSASYSKTDQDRLLPDLYISTSQLETVVDSRYNRRFDRKCLCDFNRSCSECPQGCPKKQKAPPAASSLLRCGPVTWPSSIHQQAAMSSRTVRLASHTDWRHT